jgi:hypothetical protein
MKGRRDDAGGHAERKENKRKKKGEVKSRRQLLL